MKNIGNSPVMKKYRARFNVCELCGSPKGLEVHHIIPTILGGPDTEDNMLVVCYKCHVLLTPKSVLTKLGLEKARANGKQLGQPKGTKLITKKSIKTKEIIQKLSKDFHGDLSDVEVIKQTGVARGTYYKYKKELKER